MGNVDDNDVDISREVLKENKKDSATKFYVIVS
jgi:hypothetical protein